VAASCYGGPAHDVHARVVAEHIHTGAARA